MKVSASVITVTTAITSALGCLDLIDFLAGFPASTVPQLIADAITSKWAASTITLLLAVLAIVCLRLWRRTVDLAQQIENQNERRPSALTPQRGELEEFEKASSSSLFGRKTIIKRRKQTLF